MRYVTADGTGSGRHVEPHRLVAAGRRWYLVAYDLDRDEWRIFRVDRIDAPQPTGARVTPRELPAPDAAAYVTEKMYSLAPVHTAVATLHAPIEQVRGRIGDGAGDLESIDAGRCRLRSHTERSSGWRSHSCGWAASSRCTSPPSCANTYDCSPGD